MELYQTQMTSWLWLEGNFGAGSGQSWGNIFRVQSTKQRLVSTKRAIGVSKQMSGRKRSVVERRPRSTLRWQSSQPLVFAAFQ
jgi:hypothetical protein